MVCLLFYSWVVLVVIVVMGEVGLGVIVFYVSRTAEADRRFMVRLVICK